MRSLTSLNPLFVMLKKLLLASSLALLVSQFTATGAVTIGSTTNNEKVKRFNIGFTESGGLTTTADAVFQSGSLTAPPDGLFISYFVTAPFNWDDDAALGASSFPAFLTADPADPDNPGLGLDADDLQSSQNVHGQAGGLGNAFEDNDINGSNEILLFNFGGATISGNAVNSGLLGVDGFQIQNLEFGNNSNAPISWEIFIYDASASTLTRTVTEAEGNFSGGNNETVNTGFIGEFDDGDFLIINGGAGEFRLDSVTLDVVPEPSAATLLALGAFGTLVRRRRA
ncbi:MAG: PEP-CTERM sorting domain-containing protein [Verrucomicrobiota bacterium]